MKEGNFDVYHARCHKYTDEVKDFIAKNVTGATTKALADLVNAKFGTNFTASKMKSFLNNHKLKSGIGCSCPAGLPTKLYPEEIREFIAEHYTGTGHKDMADLLNRTFGTCYTKEQMKSYYARFKLDSGLRGYFVKGLTPWNKGRKGISFPGMEATQFKKGQMPHNYKPIGSERINTDGYMEVKIQDGQFQKNWKGKHILIWEAAHGPVPPGHCLIFADGNKQNVALDNLILVSRKQLVRLNQKHLIQEDAELTKVGIAIADISNRIGERKRKQKR